MPTFGDPIIATGIPFFITFPNLNEFIKLDISDLISNNSSFNLSLFANSTSSSEKSSSSSISDAKSIKLFLKFSSFSLNPPLNCLIAFLCDASWSDSIKSAIDSA